VWVFYSNRVEQFVPAGKKRMYHGKYRWRQYYTSVLGITDQQGVILPTASTNIFPFDEAYLWIGVHEPGS